MSYFIGLLTFILVLDCLFLMLLILVQLPKKEAGMGTAFGGGATDALFGAGAGNTLTKLTKWASVIFLGLALLLSVLNSANGKGKKKSGVREALQKEAATAPAAPVAPVASSNILTAPAVTNVVPAFGTPAAAPSTGTVETVTTVTNAAAAAATNATEATTNLLQSVINTVTNEAAKATDSLKKEVEKATQN